MPLGRDVRDPRPRDAVRRPAGQLLAVGIASFAAVELSKWAFSRWPRLDRGLLARGLLLAVLTFAILMATVEDDVTNAAGRHGIPVWLAMLAASSTFGVACGATMLFSTLRSRALRLSVAAAGVAIAVANGFVLPNDYPAAHLMIVLLAALCLAHGLKLPSSVVAPFVARLLPERSAAKRALVPEEIVGLHENKPGGATLGREEGQDLKELQLVVKIMLQPDLDPLEPVVVTEDRIACAELGPHPGEIDAKPLAEMDSPQIRKALEAFDRKKRAFVKPVPMPT